MSCIAIVVNYRTSRLTLVAIESLLNHPECEKIYVVDNSMDDGEASFLREHLPPSASLHVSENNLGFAGACNLIFENIKSDFVLLLNPDARLLANGLKQMLNLLEISPNIGAVGPRVFWDESRLFQLPPTTFPSVSSQILDRIAARFCWARIFRSWRFRAKAIHQWLATKPIRVGALSGGHVLLRRSAVDAAGGLFDPAFFMYWEDTDLMMRLRSAGFFLYVEPRALCLHHYEHSPSKDTLISKNWPLYAAKYIDRPFFNIVSKLLDKLGSRVDPPCDWPVIEMTDTDLHLPLPIELHSGWLLEFSPSPSFVPSMGRIGQGSEAEIPGCCTKRFRGGDYFIRVSDVRRIYSPAQHWVARSLYQ
ncbi:MAG: glycosyltransferase family 2 protein [Rhodocyclaceae bacterium]|nr:glycosyltransferase family 2 protein [Rhodocyclaceae bacterium]